MTSGSMMATMRVVRRRKERMFYGERKEYMFVAWE